MTKDRLFLEGLVALAQERVKEAQTDVTAIKRTMDFYDANFQPAPASPEEVRSAARAVLLEATTPLHRKEIHDRLNERGVYPNGKDPVASLGAVLSRFGEDFESCGDGKWRITRTMLPGPAATVIVDDADALPW